MRIYRDAIEPSEQKSQALLRSHLDDRRYGFLVAEAEERVAGFAMVFIPEESDFWLLEYMAVDADVRSAGVGSLLFQAAVDLAGQRVPDAPGLLEVDAPHAQLTPSSPIRRRLSFYARKGCRLIDDLNYILPLSHAGMPPPMWLLLHGYRDRDTIGKTTLERWLATLYRDVYSRPTTDERLARMASRLPDRVGLVEIPSGA